MSKTHPHPTSPRRSPETVNAVLDLFVDMVADRVAARLGAAPANDYYDQRSNPLGKRRFLDAARRGAFPSTKRGKLVLARRTDVDAWIAAGHRAPVVHTKPSEDLSDEALLAASGVVLEPTPRKMKR